MEILQIMPLSGIIKPKRVFKTRYFNRWMRKTELTDAALCEAVREMLQGLIDAHLGGGLVKKRVGLGGLGGRGKRGGARTLVATYQNSRWFFVFGFEKNERDNIDVDALEAFQELASQLFMRTNEELTIAVADGTLKEICHEH